LKRNYTLAEIIFSIAALVCVGVFAVSMYVQAENMQNKARDLDMASMAAQSAIEVFKSAYSHPGTVYYDKDFHAVSEVDEKGFILIFNITDDGMGLIKIKADIEKVRPYFGETETSVFSLTTSVYIGKL